MPNDFDTTEWITAAKAAELTGYSVQYVYRIVRDGKITAKRWAREWMIDRTSLLKYQKDMEQLGSTKHDPWRTGSREKATEEAIGTPGHGENAQ